MSKYLVVMYEATAVHYEVEAKDEEEAKMIVEYEPSDTSEEVDQVPLERYAIRCELV